MNDMLHMQLTGGLGTGMDLTALVAFIAFALVYFLAPRVTHASERPVALALALYLLIGYAAISLGQLLLQWSEMLNGGAVGFNVPGRGNFAAHILFGFGAIKMGTFLLAMIAFVAGLQMLRFKDPETRAFEQAVEKLQQLRDENVRLRKRLDRETSRDDAGVDDGH